MRCIQSFHQPQKIANCAKRVDPRLFLRFLRFFAAKKTIHFSILAFVPDSQLPLIKRWAMSSHAHAATTGSSSMVVVF
jgi:hypothetical protein